MTAVERTEEGFVVEARLLADVFKLTEDEIRMKMRNGAITSRCEEGQGSDAGRWRLTFHRGDRACRFIVDQTGAVMTRASFPIRGASDPASTRGLPADPIR